MSLDSTKKTVGVIRSLCRGELPTVVARVRNSEAWTVEGRRSRFRLRAVEVMLRQLARETEEAAIIEAVETVIAINQAIATTQVLNLDSGGSRN